MRHRLACPPLVEVEDERLELERELRRPAALLLVGVAPESVRCRLREGGSDLLLVDERDLPVAHHHPAPHEHGLEVRRIDAVDDGVERVRDRVALLRTEDPVAPEHEQIRVLAGR